MRFFEVKNIKILLLIILLMPIGVYAKRGCCSHHGGLVGCSSPGVVVIKKYNFFHTHNNLHLHKLNFS